MKEWIKISIIIGECIIIVLSPFILLIVNCMVVYLIALIVNVFYSIFLLQEYKNRPEKNNINIAFLPINVVCWLSAMFKAIHI